MRRRHGDVAGAVHMFELRGAAHRAAGVARKGKGRGDAVEEGKFDVLSAATALEDVGVPQLLEPRTGFSGQSLVTTRAERHDSSRTIQAPYRDMTRSTP